jgi:hypothetical protein
MTPDREVALRVSYSALTKQDLLGVIMELDCLYDIQDHADLILRGRERAALFAYAERSAQYAALRMSLETAEPASEEWLRLSDAAFEMAQEADKYYQRSRTILELRQRRKQMESS